VSAKSTRFTAQGIMLQPSEMLQNTSMKKYFHIIYFTFTMHP